MTSTASQLASDISERVRERLEDLAARYVDQGGTLEDLGSAEQLARRMLAAVPEPSPWDGALGPFYRASGVAQLLGGVSRQAIADRRRRGTLLGLRTADGTWLYPAAQFGEDGEVLPGLLPVLRALGDAPVDRWTVAGWLASGHSALGRMSVFEWLARGGDSELAEALASDQAERYTR